MWHLHQLPWGSKYLNVQNQKHTLTEIQTISIKDNEVYPTHIGTPVSQQQQELQTSFATKRVNSQPLGIYLLNFCLILNESLFKRHKPFNQLCRVWPQIKCWHPPRKKKKALSSSQEQGCQNKYAHKHTYTRQLHPSLSPPCLKCQVTQQRSSS